MSQTGFQFHARRREIFEFAFEMAEKNHLYITGVEWFPEFKHSIICDIDQAVDDIKIRKIILSRNIPDTAASDYDFSVQNKGNLSIRPGREADGKIMESDIGCVADRAVDQLWIKMINEYKEKMLKGAWGVNPSNGARCFYKNHYYTENAKKACKDGYTLCAAAGNCVFEILD